MDHSDEGYFRWTDILLFYHLDGCKVADNKKTGKGSHRVQIYEMSQVQYIAYFSSCKLSSKQETTCSTPGSGRKISCFYAIKQQLWNDLGHS